MKPANHREHHAIVTARREFEENHRIMDEVRNTVLLFAIVWALVATAGVFVKMAEITRLEKRVEVLQKTNYPNIIFPKTK